MQPGDVPSTYADIEAGRRDLGFEPAKPITENSAVRPLVWRLLQDMIVNHCFTFRIADSCNTLPRGDSLMPRRAVAATAALAMLFSTSVFAQDASGGASTSGGAASGGASSSSDAVLTPNAPIQAAPGESPVPAGGPAGVTTASGWSPGPVLIAAGVAAIGAAVCLAVCGGGQSTTSTTKTTK
jgi:hypothetical protein